MSSELGYVVLDRFELGSTLHPELDLPILRRRSDKPTLIRLLPAVRMCSVVSGLISPLSACSFRVQREA
jgi:hypothetical protein